jgi:hypothetical protein
MRWVASNATARAILAGLSLIFVAACEQYEYQADLRRECPYMGGIDRRSGARFDPETIRRPSLSPIVKLIRLTDDGELVDRCEWADVLTEIRARPTEHSETDPSHATQPGYM